MENPWGWACAACPATIHPPHAAVCSACGAPRPLSVAVVEAWDCADVASWVASLPELTSTHGDILRRGEVSGRRLLKMRVPDLVAAGMPAGPAVDISAALDTLRGVPTATISERAIQARTATVAAIKNTTSWTTAQLTAAGATISDTLARNPTLSSMVNTLGHSFAAGAGWAAGTNTGTRVSNAALDALRIGRK